MRIDVWYKQKYNKDISEHEGYLDCSRNNLTSLEGITNLDINNLTSDLTKDQVTKEYERLELFELLI